MVANITNGKDEIAMRRDSINIGDYVEYKGERGQVSSIHAREVTILFGGKPIKCDTDRVNPIPISYCAGFLKKNAEKITKVGEYITHFYLTKDSFVSELRDTSDFPSYEVFLNDGWTKSRHFHGHIRYVHELQQAMRLVGIKKQITL